MTIATVRRFAITLVVACALALFGGVTASPAHALGMCAGGGSGPCIEFQAYYYSANGSTFIGGPAGTHVNVNGGGFVAGQTISLGVVPGDDILGVSPNPSICSQSPVLVASGLTVSSTGSFAASFLWPTGTSVGDWSVCAYTATGGALPGGNTDNTAFSVTSPYPPTVSVSPTTVLPGTTVTVSGHGWLPAQNMITVRIESCVSCQPIASYGNASSASDGSFSVPLTIPANAAFGSYLVWAGGSAIPVDTGTSGPHLTVASSLTPTATPQPKATATPRPTAHPTATPTARPTAHPTATATATATGVIGSLSSATATPAHPASGIAVDPQRQASSGSSLWLYGALIALIALAAGIGGGIYYFRRRTAA